MPIVIGPPAPTPQGLPDPGARGEAGGGGGSGSRYRRWRIGGAPRSYGPAPATKLTRYQLGVGVGLVASVGLFLFGQRLLGGAALAGTIAIMAAPKR